MQMQHSSFAHLIAIKAYCQLYYCGLKLHNTLTYLVNMRVHLFLPIMENYSHGHFMLDTVLNGQGKTHSALEVIRLLPLL